MKLRWFGQSAFLLSGTTRVAIDPCRTEAVDFLEPPDAFLAACDGADLRRLDGSEVELDDLLGTRQQPVIAVLTPPR